MKCPSIAIVGAGRLGSALAKRLRSAGYPITEIVCRTGASSLARARRLARIVAAKVTTAQTCTLNAEVVWFCVPDAQIACAADSLADKDWGGKIALHSSGVFPSDALAVLRNKGGSIASAHPLMTFAPGSNPDLAGVSFAIEGDRQAAGRAAAIVRALRGKPVRIRPPDKVAYHAFATMICPLMVSLLKASEKTAALAGISSNDARRRMLPIIRQTLNNYEQLGPARAFTGPIVRGDEETVRLHLEALAKAPLAENAYRALARAALEYLPARNRAKLKKLLQGPNPIEKQRNRKHTRRASTRSSHQS